MQMAGAAAAVGNYHNIVSQSLSLLSLFLSLSLSSSCCSQSDRTVNVVGPATPIFNVRDLTGKKEVGGRSWVHFSLGVLVLELAMCNCLNCPVHIYTGQQQ